MPQELRGYDPQGTRLQPLGLDKMAYPALSRLPASHLIRPRSTRCLPLCRPKRFAPNREEPLLHPAKMQNSDALTLQLNPMPRAPLHRDYPPNCPETP